MITDKYSNKKILIVIFIISLTIRLGFGIYTFQKQGTSKFCDDWDYISYAKNIIEQGVFAPDISKFFSNSHLVGPAYPMIIAISFKIFGEIFLPLMILNAILSAFITILIYYLGKICFNKKVGLLSSIWSIFYVPFINKIPYVLKEVPNIFVFILLTIILINVLKERKISYNTFILPVIFTFLIHMDERYFTYFPIFILMLIFVNKVNLRLQIKKFLLFAGIVLILMIPWLIRNCYVYKRPIILTERTAKFTDKIFGYSDSANKIKNKKHQLRADKAQEFTLNAFNYYTDNSECRNKSKMDSLLLNYNLSESHTIKFGQTLTEDEKLDFAKTEIDSILIGLKSSPNYFVTGTKYYTIGGLKYNLKPHKFSYWERRWAEFKEYFRSFRLAPGYIGSGFRFQGIWSFKHNFSLTITYGILLPFFVIGINFLFWEKNKYGMILLIMILVHMIIHVFLEHVRNRYRFPTDPFIIIIAFYGAHRLFNIINDFNLRKRI